MQLRRPMALCSYESPYPWQLPRLHPSSAEECCRNLLRLVSHEEHLLSRLLESAMVNQLCLGSLPANVLPCSKVIEAASLSQFSLTNCVNLNMICCLAITLVALHAGNAFCALSTAALSSASVLWGTLVTRLFVAGSCNSMKLEVSDFKNLLSIKYGVSCTSWIFSCVVG